MAILTKATAYNRVFLMIQSSDHITGLTGATPTVLISKAGGAFGSPAGAVTEIADGYYQCAYTTADTGTAGDLSFYATATSGDPTGFVDQVWDPTVAMTGVNVVAVLAGATNVKKNQIYTGFMFLMTATTTNLPATGLTVTAQRSLDGGSFSNCANAVSEISGGTYVINLAAADTNANHVMLQFTATGANQLNVELITTP